MWSSLFVLLVAQCVAAAPAFADEEDFYIPGVTLYRGATALPEIALIDHHGAAVKLSSWRGQWMVVYFGYLSCPDACPATMAVLKQVWKRIRHDPQFKKTRIAFVSLDPHRDKVDQIAEYIDYFDPELLGYTGQYPDLVKLAAACDVEFEYEDVATGRVLIDPAQLEGVENYYVNHSSSVAVISPQTQLVAHIHGTQDPQALIEILGQIQRRFALPAPN